MGFTSIIDSLKLGLKLFVQTLNSIGLSLHQLPVLHDRSLDLFEHLTAFITRLSYKRFLNLTFHLSVQ